MNTKNRFLLLIPVMLSFFVMGFVDVVGIATNYIKADFQLSDSVANMFPSMVFLWFLLLAIPTSMLMNKIGCRKTVLLSVVVTAIALLFPFIDYSLEMMLISFALLGIGNTLIQVSLNPLLANIVSGDRLASSLTLGQFMKAIASFLGPIVAGWMLLQFGSWRYLYPLFFAIALIAALGLSVVSIEERKEEKHSSSFAQCLSLLGDKFILLLFLGIVCHVGMDVGINMTVPKILIERLGIDLSEAGYASSVYFLFRTVGCFAGAFVLAHYASRKFFMISIICLSVGLIGLLLGNGRILLYASIAAAGLGNANVFPIIFSQALLHKSSRQNEISGLMIMGLLGGAIFPMFMGLLSDYLGAQAGAVLVLCIGAVYLVYVGMKMHKSA